jgi:hypothetical protein
MSRRRDLAMRNASATNARASTVEPDPRLDRSLALFFFFFILLNVNDWHDDAAHFFTPFFLFSFI